ncbi:calcium-activated potassium channel subunit beta-3 isoform X1 [Toxotes jaculatrix]|uniref:calcium-activated potassium channel subunit beta-3 isoform X1 n=1 Tax=Toxotes jaculatrix TaxID=941984 RepID=UPI001B3B09FA|nr:calcium-activated potassium channel subunit beta-3 isoform X1 [Toxotes jaculatrix]
MKRHRTHVFGEVLRTTVAQEQEWSKGVDGRGGERARPQMPVSSVGEDRAILLGFSMMAFSALMFFLVGITTVKPYVNSNWKEEASCVLLQADILKEWVDCRGVSTVPCLRVTVNLTASNQSALLHFDEESVFLSPECFYIPKCQMDRAALQDEVQRVKTIVASKLENSSCLTDPTGTPWYPHVILKRKYTLETVLFALLWPCLLLGGGALLVGLVKLTQFLAHLSSEMCSETARSRLTSGHTRGKLYRLHRRSSIQSPT